MSEYSRTICDGTLTVRIGKAEDVQLVALCGELDLANAETAKAELETVLADEAVEAVVDMRELEFIDSTGIALLVATLNGHGDGGRLRFIPSRSPAVHRVLEVTGIEDKLPLADDGSLGEESASPSL